MVVPHQPVMVEEVLLALACKPNVKAIYFDCTVGMGGHSEAILKATSPDGRVIGIDWDEEALIQARKRLIPFQDRMILCRGSFQEMGEIAKRLDIVGIDGILFDLGVSSLQLTSPERGFSFQTPGPLDMRMDQRLPQTAADWVNTLREEELANLIYRYGEERRSRRIAKALVRHREKRGPITRTEELSEIVCRVVKSTSKRTRIHPATKTFQALRMAVNDEQGELTAGLSQAISLLSVGGRLVVISFHSLEDRPVKICFKEAVRTKREAQSLPPRRFIHLYKKPIVPKGEERVRNPRARSAKLRALERVA